jgi:hypothetical protein
LNTNKKGGKKSCVKSPIKSLKFVAKIKSILLNYIIFNSKELLKIVKPLTKLILSCKFASCPKPK